MTPRRDSFTRMSYAGPQIDPGGRVRRPVAGVDGPGLGLHHHRAVAADPVVVGPRDRILTVLAIAQPPLGRVEIGGPAVLGDQRLEPILAGVGGRRGGLAL